LKDNEKIKHSVISKGDIYEHLALEDYLFTHNISSLLLYTNAPVVVIGKHQNPWIETDPMIYPIARRQSGGGSVYHDEGNLNYSVILPKDQYNREKIFQIIKNALKSINIETSISPNFSIFFKDKKVSGSAFRQNSRTVLHHGTLLVQTDLSVLKSALLSPYSYDDTRSTKSNPSPVINLNDIYHDLSVTDVIQSVIKAFEKHYNLSESHDYEKIKFYYEFRKNLNKHRNPEWLFGGTLSYYHSLMNKSKKFVLNNTLWNNKHIILEDAYEKAGISQ